MTIAFGRRRLIVEFITAPPRKKSLASSVAESATDRELARLNGYVAAMEDRRRWEADAILYGVVRPR